jgi:rubrerythrin
VGQGAREEVNVQPASSPGGENYGWRLKEGTRVTGLDPLDSQPVVDPVHEFDHSNSRQAIIGGYVYRGARIPELAGSYFFADYTGPIWSFRHECGRVTDLTARESELFSDDAPVALSSFGEDAAGDLYVISLSPGEVYRVEAKPEGDPSLRTTAARSRVGRKRGRFGSLRWVKPPGARAAAPKAAPEAGMDPVSRAVREIGLPEVEDARTPAEEARFLLQAAAEVEHALLVQYLYAAYSLDPAGDIAGWRDVIAQIAKEEMGHLLTVQNLLLAIGGTPYFDREDPAPGPEEAAIYPFPLRLQPLTLSSLAKYVTTESPLPDQLQAELRARAEPAFALSRQAIGIGINHVGVLYARLYWLFQPDETPQGPWKLPPGVFPARHLATKDFAAPRPDHQATPNEGWYGAESGPYNGTILVKTIASAMDGLTALDYIARQGEGWEATDNDDTHFERFLVIFEQLVARLEQGASSPTLPVPVNPFTGDSPDPDPAIEQNRITHPTTRLWADLFDLRYRMLVLELSLLMSLPRTDDKRARLINHAVRQQMMNATRQINDQLVRSPRASGAPGGVGSPVAGPPFRLSSAPLPSDPDGQRQMLKDCMAACAALYPQLEAENRQLVKRLRLADAELPPMLEP